jgi:hypothetical protein
MNRARLRTAIPVCLAVAAAVSLGPSLWQSSIAANAAPVAVALDAVTIAKGAALVRLKRPGMRRDAALNS